MGIKEYHAKLANAKAHSDDCLRHIMARSVGGEYLI